MNGSKSLTTIKKRMWVETRFYTRIDKIVLSVFVLLMILAFIAWMYPLVYALISSFSKGVLPLDLFPRMTTLEGYRACLADRLIWSGFKNSIIYTVLGTGIALVVTILCAFCLSVKTKLRKVMLLVCMITMYFDGGLIPNFLWIKKIGLYNTMWAVILPVSLSIYNMLVMRTYFESSIPESLREAAELDGASIIQYLVLIVLPLSGSVIAVVALYYASSLWNSYFNAMIYLQQMEKLPLANILRNLLITSQMSSATSDSVAAQLMEERQEVMKYCVIVIATVPMMVVYPFIQKYFVKGVMIGAVKG